MPLVSIIVPIYNAEKYLEKCLDSIRNQTLKDIEIICVNDGSTDASLSILESYAKRDSRIKIISKENAGLVAARKTGVAEAKGKYIGYVDSDDWIEPDMYASLFELAEINQADMVTSGYFLEGNYTTVHLDTVEEGVYTGELIEYLRENAIYCTGKKEVGIRASLCCKLFRTELLRDVQAKIPNEITLSEDKLCLVTFLLECSSVVVEKKAYYHYRINTTSMTHEANTEYLLHMNRIYQYLIGLYSHKNFTEAMRTQVEIYIIERLIHGINTHIGLKNRNLLWVDPYWLNNIPENAKIVLYGAGDLGEKYKKQLASRKDVCYLGCVDFGYERFVDSAMKVESPEKLCEMEYDYIVVTIKNPMKAQEIKEKLLEYAEPEKIKWFRQDDIFWRFVESEGILSKEE